MNIRGRKCIQCDIGSRSNNQETQKSCDFEPECPIVWRACLKQWETLWHSKPKPFSGFLTAGLLLSSSLPIKLGQSGKRTSAWNLVRRTFYQTVLVFQYLHDGSDTTTDNLRLVARTAGVDWPEKDKTSVAANLRIIVQPVRFSLSLSLNCSDAMFWVDRLIGLNWSPSRSTTQFPNW